MQLFERIAKIAREVAGSQARLAEKINVNPRTFQGYVQAGRQDNLWPLLPDILDNYPNINREWLYFDEGEMLGGGGLQKPPTPHIDVALLRQVIEMLEEHLQAVKAKMSPAAKATVVSQLYEMLVEQEAQAREPIQMMRLVMGALAKAANE